MVWQPGKKLRDGRYTIESILGKGGFGITYLARDTYLRKVAIKTLNDDVKNSPYFKKLHDDFQNEAKLLQQCAHSNIVEIYDLFLEQDLVLGLFSRGEPLLCMVMEYISEGNLSEIVETHGALASDKALRYIDQIGQVLTFIHTRNILHRDIKPNNIMVRSDGTVALIDFGIARSFIEGKTQVHTVYLTPGFAPPEQFMEQDKRGAYSDVYALAATLYFLLTGSPPRFDSSKLKPPKELNSSINDIVNQAIVKGMEFSPEDRPQSVEQWLQLLVPKQELQTSASPSMSTPANPWLWVLLLFVFWTVTSSVFIVVSPVVSSTIKDVLPSLDTRFLDDGYSTLASWVIIAAVFFAADRSDWMTPTKLLPISILSGAIIGLGISISNDWNDLWSLILGQALLSFFFCLIPSVAWFISVNAKRNFQYVSSNSPSDRFMALIILTGISALGILSSWLIGAWN